MKTKPFKQLPPPVVEQRSAASAPTNTRKVARHPIPLWRFAVLLILIIYHSFSRFGTMSSAQVDLSQYSKSIFVPFIHKFSIKHDPQVICTIEGIKIKMPVDTGSTGLLIGAPMLPNLSSTIGTPAHHFFTSSKILYVGRLVELPINFHGEGSSYASATVPVFIVDKSWRCPAYDPSKDTFECPLGPNGEKPVERDTSHITYMGVGFGRNQPRDGMPFGAPKLNPLLNIVSLDGEPVDSSSMRAGYSISTAGVQIGLTQDNIRNFAFINLEPGLTHSQDQRDWAMARMCFNTDDGEPNCGAALVDTGIAQMYLRADKDRSIPTIHIRNPNKHGYAKMVKRVKPGTSVGIGFPSLQAPVASYSLIVGGESINEPSAVIPLNQTAPPYINTGRSFLFDYSIAFDATGGRFGFRPTRSPGAVL
ncbi:hypothetical protein IAQ61_011812 [Plenodomus lingam]|uniref:Peptidase A1 domain-containing protein n=1 Tax=Leptosphaeria maculans (strain JN3 / isolate v23.1.3 / race Av1-4-5-6-7-8) TaxID=985895 RepID=E5AB68_LEPMJ|nr:hypothetical protein LEMA_P020390.1 [Plenodomus lingam JN3]KAH9860028.1 hypothetical protein IAQ61_011812 [Plenodomus lingam]CBY00909.1 hypothetical protein LEMA_P020390.1 [Plenodomus lingam JN3]